MQTTKFCLHEGMHPVNVNLGSNLSDFPQASNFFLFYIEIILLIIFPNLLTIEVGSH